MPSSSTDGATSTAAPTPSVSIRGDPAAAATPPPAASAPNGGVVIPEGKVAVWDATMQQMVIKDKEDVKLQVGGHLCSLETYRHAQHDVVDSALLIAAHACKFNLRQDQKLQIL